MITIAADTLKLILEKQASIFIDTPQTISGCCLEITECPSVRFGVPRQLAGYTRQSIQGVTVFVPDCFPSQGSFEIRTRRFLGFTRLIMTGWRLA